MVSACLWHANSQPSTPQTTHHWLDAFWRMPVLNFFASIFRTAPDLLPDNSPEKKKEEVMVTYPAEFASCSVAPLDLMQDEAAEDLEASLTAPINISDMNPAAARALD